MTNAFLRRHQFWAIGLFVLTVLALVWLRPLLPIDETRYFTVAWEMWQGGSKFVPHLNGELYSHKPPLFFWLINLTWAVTGVSEFAARLVAPAFGLASIVLTAKLAHALWPETRDRAGFAALILATGGVFLLIGSSTRFDTMLTASVVGAMLALLAVRRAPGIWPILGLGGALALGVMAKGPVVLVHVLPVAVLMPLWADRGTRPTFGRWYQALGLGVVVALCIVLLWLGPALILGGSDYRTDVLWRQSAGRMVESFAHKQPIWFFAALLPVFIWPWGWNMAALAALSPRILVKEEASRFLVIWAMSALVAFSLISGKQVQYLLPELPALALLLSVMSVRSGSTMGRALLLVPILVISGLALAIFMGFVPQASVNGASMPFILLAVIITVSLCFVVASFRVFSINAMNAVVAPVTMIVLHLAIYPTLWAGYNPDALASALAKDQIHGVATTDTGYAGQFSFSARLDRPVAILADPGDVTNWITAHPGGLIITRTDMVDPAVEQILRRSFHGKDYRFYRVKGATP